MELIQIPTQICGRCAGLIVREYDEIRCLNCGYRPEMPVQEEPNSNPLRQWTPIPCRICGCSSVRGYDLCRPHCRRLGEIGTRS